MKNKKGAVLSAILAGLLLIVAIVPAVSAYTDDDPLITLSYLEEVIMPSFREELLELIAVDSSDIEDEETEEPSDAETADTQIPAEEEKVTSSATGTYTLLELKKGQVVMADSICEFIVRPGSNVVAVSPFEGQGIADITNGVEVLDGTQISINAYCLIPRGSDGRGMRVESENAYIMIRGEYTIG